MALSRRLRFEVLRRDGYTCQYCGARGPDVTLEVDHVVPTTLGGDDEPRNLLTACQPCNAGKASIPPDAELVADVDATALLFRGAVERIAAERRADRATINTLIAEIDEWWRTSSNVVPDRPDRWVDDIERFYALGFDRSDLWHYLRVAWRSRAGDGNVWRYFCGCCWRELTTRQELARRLIEDGDA